MTSSQTDVDDLLAIERGVMRAIQDKDQPSLDRLLAPGFVLRMPGNQTIDRAGFLEMVRAIPGSIESIQGHEIQASVIDGVGVVTGIQQAIVRLDDGGSLVTSRTAFTDVFCRRGESWQLVLASSVELSPTRGDG